MARELALCLRPALPARADLPSFLDSADFFDSARCCATASELVAFALIKRPHLRRVRVRARG